jgi:hypothetical protein
VDGELDAGGVVVVGFGERCWRGHFRLGEI